MPDPLKLFIKVAGFRVSVHASLKTLANVYLFIGSPEFSHMFLLTHLFQFDFMGLKKPTSQGCRTCVVCGGKQYRRMPSSFAYLAVFKLICEECPSSSSSTGRAGGIDLLKWFLSQPLNIHPEGDCPRYAPWTAPSRGLDRNRSPGNTCIGGMALPAALIQARVVICCLLEELTEYTVLEPSLSHFCVVVENLIHLHSTACPLCLTSHLS